MAPETASGFPILLNGCRHNPGLGLPRVRPSMRDAPWSCSIAPEDLPNGHDPQGVSSEFEGAIVVVAVEPRGGLDVAGQPQLGHPSSPPAADEVADQGI